MKQHRIFQFRAFISLLATFSFVTLAVTGVILYITPPGRSANWTNWTFWTLTKQQWIGLHICFSTLFLIVSVLHIWLNFKPLINYFVNKTQAALKFRVEWLKAMTIIWNTLDIKCHEAMTIQMMRRIKWRAKV